MDRRVIARKATAEALQTRRQGKCGLDTPICVYDLANQLEIEVRFVDIPSMEGMYINTQQPHIILSSLRPFGRRAFTCAHELAHHVRQDGMHVDEVLEQNVSPRFDPVEFAANCFAGALLMPKTAVERAFAIRDWKVIHSTPAQIYTISNNFGVGYTTLIHHLHMSLRLLTHFHAERLLKVTPRQAQSQAIGWETPHTVWVVDRHWKDRAIDVEVGDLVYLHERPRLEGNCVELTPDIESKRVFRVVKPGIARLEDNSGWSAFIRASRRDYIGRGIFRHFEEVDD